MKSCHELDMLDTDGVKLERVPLQTTDPCLLLEYVRVCLRCVLVLFGECVHVLSFEQAENKVLRQRQEVTHMLIPIHQLSLTHTHIHGKQQCYDNNSEFYGPL